ncbi:MAG: carboxypeptidase regulatory-like domain-containing protein [Bryobacteraceae bacterium]
MKNRTLLRVRGNVLALLLLFSIPVQQIFGQGTTATILGTVTDASGAAVPDVAIQVKNIGTGLVQNASSDAQGRYTAANLGIGDYEVQASKPGFTTALRRGIALTVGSQNLVDFALQVGQQQQTITVEAAVTQVETTNATVGALTDQRQMRELPLNGRNFQQLVLLAPGVQTMTTVNPNARQGRELSFAAAGARPENQGILLDDENLQNFYRRGVGTVTGTSLGVEAIAEFQTLVNTYGAQFGGNGMVVNAVTKSGTNTFHGSAYEFHRNSAFDARRFFDTVKRPGENEARPPSFKRNQFGGTFAGPLIKDKAFFFVNYEGIREGLGQSSIANVPSASNRLPTFARATNPAMYDAIAGILRLYPLPDTIAPGASAGQTTLVATRIGNENYYLGRFDYNVSDKDTIFGRYIFDKQDLLDPFTGTGAAGSVMPYFGESDIMNNQFLTVQWRHIISPTMVNTARGSFTRLDTNLQPGFPQIPELNFIGGRINGAISIQGISSVGPNTFIPAFQVQNKFTESDDVLWTHGSHNTRFGIVVVRQQSNVWYPFGNGGTWNFQSLALFQAGTAQQFTGTPTGPQYYANRDYRETQFPMYIQDDWKVSSRLTFNLGLRYEFVTHPRANNNTLYAVTDYVNGTDLVNVPRVSYKNPNTGNFDPRFGFAWDVFGDHKTSLRGGFGITHSPVFTGNFHAGAVKPWDRFQQLNPQFPTPFTGGNPSLPSGISFDYYTGGSPYLMQYNVNVQREIVEGTVLSVGYVGSRGVRLFSQREMNPFLATVTNGVYQFATTGARRINQNLGGLGYVFQGTSSNYNSLQANINRRLTRSVQAQVNYTWSKCLDDGGSPLGTLQATGSPTAYTNPYDRSIDYGPCAYDIRHAFRLNGLWLLPFHGNRLVEGWQLSGIWSANTGYPLTINTGFDRMFVGGQGRPNYVAGCDVKLGTVNQWFNPACFTLQAAGTTGNVGRSTLYGPNLSAVDLALLKDLKLTEALRVQFRAEGFNILNRANFGAPNINVFTAAGVNPLAGRIQNVVTSARQLQFALKFIF